jgi:hypothetical protein
MRFEDCPDSHPSGAKTPTNEDNELFQATLTSRNACRNDWQTFLAYDTSEHGFPAEMPQLSQVFFQCDLVSASLYNLVYLHHDPYYERYRFELDYP